LQSNPAVDAANGTLERLETETRSYHRAADAGWRSLMTTEVSAHDYVGQLVRVFGFEGPLEAALAYTSHLELLVDVHERFRAGFIAQDLLALGLKPGEIARLPQCVLAPFASPLEGLGWLYVVERTALMHDEVRRYLGVRLPQAREACVYLTSAERHVRQRWHELGHQIERAVRSQRAFDELASGARAAFRTWINWSTRGAERQRFA
jgi:heme oxygenase